MHDRRTVVTAACLAVLSTLTVAATPSPAASDDTVTLTLVATNDVHRRLVPIDDPERWDHGLGGVALLAAHIGAVRERAPELLHVDGGDLTGGGGSGLGVPGGYADEATVDAMDQMGLDVTTVGNHEFDAGVEELRRVRTGGCWMDDCAYRHGEPYTGAGFTTLAANAIVTATGEPVLPAWTIRESQGVQVGFVGVTETSTIPAEGNESITFTPTFDAIAPAVADVREAGADVVVLLLHQGSRQQPEGAYDANACEGITGHSSWYAPWVDVDVIVDGHTHEAYVCDIPGVPLLTQASQRGVMFTEITLTYDRAAGEVVDRAATNRLVTPDLAPDPAVADIVERYRTRWAQGPSDGGTAPVPDGSEQDGDEPEGPQVDAPVADEPATSEPPATEPPGTERPPSEPPRTDDRTGDRPARQGGGSSVDLRDIAGTTHERAIRGVAAAGITTGYGDGTFRPNDEVTRGQMGTFLQRALGLPAGSAGRFDDVGAHPHAAGIGAVARAGITTGFPDGSYRPNAPVTRGQMATFLQRALDLPQGSADRFADVREHAHAAGIGAVARAGITEGSGDGTFRPDGSVTRGQMASFLARALDL